MNGTPAAVVVSRPQGRPMHTARFSGSILIRLPNQPFESPIEQRHTSCLGVEFRDHVWANIAWTLQRHLAAFETGQF